MSVDIKANKPKVKRYLVADDHNLALEVMTLRSKVWRYRYPLHGKQRETGQACPS